MVSGPTFTSDQKEYLSGFFAGANQRGFLPYAGRNGDGQITADAASGGSNLAEPETVHGTPIEDLSKEERIKYELHGLDCYDRIQKCAAENVMPEKDDIFRFKYYGLFNVAPAQEFFMLRGRLPGGYMKSYQMDGLADIAENLAGGFADLTTRGNFQLRQIEPKNCVKLLESLIEVGLGSRGSGADNLRNITGPSTAGIDPDEIFDVSELTKAMHHCILNTRKMYDLPRKFNITFDGGGAMSTCSDTNDIAFYAVKVPEGKSMPAGVYFRVQLAGITGHKQFASDSGILIKAEECIAVAVAMVEVFSENGDRTKRNKSRLKYLIDKWGTEKFLEETEKKLSFSLPRVALEECEERRPISRQMHIGVHRQKQEGMNYVGVVFPVGRMLPYQMRGVAELARQFGNGELRLTVWQNLLIPFIKDEDVEAVKAGIDKLSVTCDPHNIKTGLIACTGSKGCKYASCDTKGNALELGEYLSEDDSVCEPINIHVTGCHHSCAQHYIGDIGMQATKVKVDGESVEGYNIVLGGGVDSEQNIAKEVFKGVPFTEVKPLLKGVIKTFEERREGGESFIEFNQRRTEEELRELYGQVTA
ncbi:NirA family protein [Puniceicoccaceae bacterium K14]|nr:NirA family protein [Puniceicoccaceae bacterium K14]